MLEPGDVLMTTGAKVERIDAKRSVGVDRRVDVHVRHADDTKNVIYLLAKDVVVVKRGSAAAGKCRLCGLSSPNGPTCIECDMSGRTSVSVRGKEPR